MIQKNGLNFVMAPDGSYLCKELLELPTVFAERFSAGEVEKAIDLYLSLWRSRATIWFPPEEQKPPLKERIALGQRRFDKALADVMREIKRFSLFQKFLFWFCSWSSVVTLSKAAHADMSERELREVMMRNFLVRALPEPIREVVQYEALLSMTSSNGHFALLFEDSRHKDVRRIVTNSQLFEIRGIAAYSYLDLLPDGKPLGRWVCDEPIPNRRIFFDGTRLMTHANFTSCAPRPLIRSWGYAVNSSRMNSGNTIVNGMLFNRLYHDDAKKIPSIRMVGSRVMVGKEQQKPIGCFAPSRVKLLDSGFALYDRSEFQASG